MKKRQMMDKKMEKDMDKMMRQPMMSGDMPMKGKPAKKRKKGGK